MTASRISERALFTGATAIAVAHAVDDALLGRQAGEGVADHALALLVAVACGVAGVLLFARLRPGTRAGLVATFGVLATANGAQHVIHIAVDGPSGSDLTGVLAAAAGLLLVALGASLPYRHRDERPVGRAPRRRNRAIGTVLTVAAAFFVVMPAAVAVIQTHAFREPVGQPPSAAYRPISFRATDGLKLKGWYVPSRNGAAVVLVHGGGGDRRGPLDHARMLARHGYGVLVYDARGRGESEGSPNAYGWEWPKDVQGAIAFLRSRPEIDGDRIGGLGLSTGADVLIEVAARSRDLKAIVADGATGRSEDDALGDPVTNASYAATFAAVRVLTGTQPGPPLRELVADVAPTPLLLVSSGLFPAEREFNLKYAQAAGEGAELWDLRDVHHTSAVRERAAEYERRVVGLFDDALENRR